MATDPAEVPRRPESRFRFLLTSKWIGFHLLVVVLVVTMVNLAFWQLRRLDERRQFNAQVRANANQPIGPLSQVNPAVAAPAAIEWRRVKVVGTYVPGHEFLVVNRSQNGDSGRNVVDALQLADGTLLLVNRGFVREEDGTPALPNGTIEIVGRLRASERRGTGQPADASTGVLTEIRRIDVGVLSKQFDTTVLPMYVEQLESAPADAESLEPIVAPTLDEGPHLSYTVQWFIFSGCVIVGWVLAVRRSLVTRSGKPMKKRRAAYVPIADDDSMR